MRRVKITKNIVDKGAWFMGLSKKQIVVSVVGLAVAGITLWKLWGVVPTDVMMTIIFIEISVVAAIAFIKVNGVSLIYVLLSIFKKKRITYHSRKDGINIGYRDEEETKK